MRMLLHFPYIQLLNHKPTSAGRKYTSQIQQVDGRWGNLDIMIFSFIIPWKEARQSTPVFLQPAVTRVFSEIRLSHDATSLKECLFKQGGKKFLELVVQFI